MAEPLWQLSAVALRDGIRGGAFTSEAETSARPPALADMRCAKFPMPFGR